MHSSLSASSADGTPPVRRLRPAPLWRVHIERHAVPPRYLVRARTTTVPAVSEGHACEIAVQTAHCAAAAEPVARVPRQLRLAA
jgi:hypothetical protein